MSAHVLYRFYSATGQLLYVGITMNPPQRFNAHRQTKDWWGEVSGITIETYGSRKELASAERRAIEVEHPLHNIVRPKLAPCDPVEPDEVEPEPAPPHGQMDTVSGLFATLASAGFTSFPALFGGSDYRDTCYGYIRKDEYERRVNENRAKLKAIIDCPLCDDGGYRNLYLCNHSLRSGYLRAAQERVARERLQLVEGGAI